MRKIQSLTRFILLSLTCFALLECPAFAGSASATKTVLLDIGRSNADGGWYGGATPTSPDTNGNYWNTLDIGKFAGNMVDKAGGATTIGAGFIDTNNPVFTTWNGPAGGGTLADVTINSAALGDLGIPEAAFDYVQGTNIRLSIDGLTIGKKYRINLYSSRRWEGDAGTTFSVYSANTFDPASLLATGTLANRSATDGWVHNADTILTFDNLAPTGTDLYINLVGSSGGAGALNALSVQELDTTPPTIALLGNNPLILTAGTAFTDPGATVTDNSDASRTITGTGSVDTSAVGTYTVTYNATDVSGNTATPVTRTVFVKLAVAKTVLLDIGRSGTSGVGEGWYNGATPPSPDTNGNYWNTLDSGKYAGSMKDKTNGTTSIGAGFIDTNSPTFTTYNGPAGDGTLAAVTINSAALGDLGIAEAAFDYVCGTNIRMSIDGLTVGKKYRINLYSSRRWGGDAGTTFSVYGDNTFDPASLLATGTLANRSATDGWVHNADTILTFDNLAPTGTDLYINLVGSSGGEGALNALSVQELVTPQTADTTPPVITLNGNNPETIIWGSTYSDAGATATDNEISISVIVDSTDVNTSIIGSYSISYTATDAATNIASTNRTVEVILPANAITPGADGLSPLIRYALGGSSPTSTVSKPVLTTDTNDLILTALVRTSGVTVIGESSTNLPSEFVPLAQNPQGTATADQTNLLPGTQRREFRAPKDATKKFLRLKVTNP